MVCLWAPPLATSSVIFKCIISSQTYSISHFFHLTRVMTMTVPILDVMFREKIIHFTSMFILNNSYFLYPIPIDFHLILLIKILISLVHRALNICFYDNLLKAKLNYIKSVAIDRCFLIEMVDLIHKTHFEL